MGAWLIPVLLGIIGIVIAFIVLEVFFAKRGQRSMVEQHRVEGNDEEPKTF